MTAPKEPSVPVDGAPEAAENADYQRSGTAASVACGKPTKHGPHGDCVGIPLPPIEAASLACRYPQVEAFAALMLAELDANSRKGDAWTGCEPRTLLHDITWHWAKLARALADYEDSSELQMDPAPFEERLREHAADVANMSLMLLDSLGLLAQGASDV